MSFDFPSSPTDGQEYAPSGGPTYVWHPSVWTVKPAASVSAITPSDTAPAMDGTTAAGTSALYSRGDHIHPTDATRYAATNPSGYQTAAQVTASLGAYLPLAGGNLTGPLTGPSINLTTGITAAAGQINTSLNIGTASVAGGSYLVGPAGTDRGRIWTTGALNRWILLCSSTAEGGANAGSDILWNSYNDAGAYLATPIGIKRSTGVVTFSAAIVNGSDARMKENVEPVADALAIVQALQGVFYTVKNGDGKRQVGLIAQDTAAPLPEVVFETADAATQQASQFGLKEGDGPLLGVAYGNCVAVLIEAVKTLAARVAALEAPP